MNKWQMNGNQMPPRWSHSDHDNQGRLQTSIHPKGVLSRGDRLKRRIYHQSAASDNLTQHAG